MQSDSNNLACRVCGNLQGEPPWGEDGCPTDDICDCCETQFGYEDCQLSAIKAARQRWLTKDANWKYPKKNWHGSNLIKNGYHKASENLPTFKLV
jgi:hypothetical protein